MKGAALAFALCAAAAPVDNEKRQFDSLPSLTLPAGGGSALPTGLGGLGSGTLGGLGGTSGSSGLTGSSGSFGGLGSGSIPGLGGSTGSSGLGSGGLTGGSTGLTGLTGSSGSDLTGLSGLSGSSGSLAPTTTFGKRQFGSGTSGFGGLTSSLSGSSGSFGGLSGLGGSTGTSSGTTGTSSGSSGTSTSSSASDGSCKAISLLFARGTGETGTMGTVIGPPLATALGNAAGADKVYSEGVAYAASSAGNANMGADGGAAMAKQAQAILSSCPDTKLVLSGYSQGAMVVHNALSSQGLDGSKVAAVVAFGDPFNGQDFKGVDAGKVKEFCGSSDFLCSSGGTTGSGSHISYGGDAEAAASFIVQAVGA